MASDGAPEASDASTSRTEIQPLSRDYLERFYDSDFSLEEHTDCTVRCRGVEFRLHKILLAAASPHFERALSRNLPFQEGLSGVLDLGDDDDPNLVKLLLSLSYLTQERFDKEIVRYVHGNYESYKEKTVGILAFNIDLYAIADKYMVYGPLKVAETAIANQMAKFHSDSKESDACLSANSYVAVAAKMFATPCKDLHHMALNFAAKYLSSLKHSRQFWEMMDDNFAFRHGLISYLTNNRPIRLKCHHCEAMCLVTFGWEFTSTRKECLKWKCRQCRGANTIGSVTYNSSSDKGEEVIQKHHNLVGTLVDEIESSSRAEKRARTTY
ncbi:hypothetical protein HDK64DRAFT_332633 [Phyllosticta capitalensis]